MLSTIQLIAVNFNRVSVVLLTLDNKTERKRRSIKNVIFTTDNLADEPVQIEDDRLSSGGNFSLQ